MKSLSTRLALVLALVLLALMIAAGMWVERQLTRGIENEEINQAKIHAQTLLASLQTLMLNGQGTLARDWLDRMQGTAGIVDIQILRRDGHEAFTDLETLNRVNAYLDEPRFDREPVPPHGVVSEATLDAAFERALTGETAVELRFPSEITLMKPIRADTECLACHGYDSHILRGVLKLSLSREQAVTRIEQMRVKLWWIVAGLVAVVAFAVWSILRVSVLRPIHRLRDAISLVGSGQRDVKLPLQWRDELGQLASVFHAMQENLEATETRIRAVTDNVFDAIITTDEQGIMDNVNPAVERMFGFRGEELVGRNVTMLMPEAYRVEHDIYIQRYLKTGRGRIINNRAEVVGQRKDGSTFPMEIALSEMFIGEQRYFVGVARDVTERKRQTAALQYQALHDALTELPNRTLLSDRIRQAVLMAQRSHQSFALLVMDLDRFKEINDTLGHQYGDRLLQQVAKRMCDVLRESDTIARLGGDEFAVLLPATNADQAEHIAGKLLKAMDKPFEVDGQILHVGVSIGITLFPQHGDDEVTLLQRADVAMYVAKRNHHGYDLYDPTTDQHSLRNLALLGQLRNGIDHNELELYFQPKISMTSGRVFAVEALVRWHHPEHGLMRPDEFMPLAEQTGLIGPLSQWVLTAGLEQCRQHRHGDVEMEIAINISARNLQDPNFPQRVARLINEACGDAAVRFEITETAVMADPVRAMDALNALHAMGVKLSIDDFGTGYSSLAHLKQMPVDELKIDQSFVRAMVHDENDAVIVRSIIDLAHNIGLHVVAEGVEDQQTYDMLAALGCDAAQGIYMCGPLPVGELMDWLAASPWGFPSRRSV